MPGTIVVGYDGTHGADAALTQALAYAKRLDCDIAAVFAYDKVTVGGESRDLDEEVHARGSAMLDQAAARAAQAGVGFSSEFIEGSAADALVQLADARDAELIVVGSYGDKPLRGVLVGATPFKLIHLSERPILVVRAPEEE